MVDNCLLSISIVAFLAAPNCHDWWSLDVPHGWSIEGGIEASNPTGNDGGCFPAGIGWYRRTFDVPEALEGKIISIYFEGVYMNAEVFIDHFNMN